VLHQSYDNWADHFERLTGRSKILAPRLLAKYYSTERHFVDAHTVFKEIFRPANVLPKDIVLSLSSKYCVGQLSIIKYLLVECLLA
jgi:hypothetical protein